MTLEFSGTILFWKGPAPFYFVPVPEQQSNALKEVLSLVTYGWGMVPVVAQIGETQWKTSLFPKDGRYLVPLKDKIRVAEHLDQDDTVTVRLEVSGL